MRIIIIANFPDELDGAIHSRFTNLAIMLQKRGHDVEMIVSDFLHSTKRPRENLNNHYEFKLTYIHEPAYSSNISFKRLWSHYMWGWHVRKYLKKLEEKPDVVYAALPSFSAGRFAGEWCNNIGVKYVVDVQDLWPEAFKVAIKNRILQMAFWPMERIANSAYKAADFVIGVSDTYCDRAVCVNKKVDVGLTVYLGNNRDVFDNARDVFNVQKPTDEFWIAYVGTMGYSYDVNLATDAIKMVQEEGLTKKVKLVAMGRGPLLDDFKKHAEEAGINYEFTGALPYEIMVGKMCSCDAVINSLRPGAAQSITNKVGDYALSGLPVINTQENAEYRQLVDYYHCGINCECGNVRETANAIAKLVNNPSLCEEMGKNARRLGVERFDRRTSYIKIIETLENICK